MRVKVCGLTRPEDARLARELGAFALGFIFYAKSPRFVDAEAVSDCLKSLGPLGDLRTVGVFVNASLEEIREAVRVSGINTVQLHGDESPEFAAQLTGLTVWKAFRIREISDYSAFAAYEPFVEALLVDAAAPGHYGGSGQRVPHELLDAAPRRKPLIIAGGLKPESVSDVWTRNTPWALDLSSGVESQPGIKDHEALRRLFGR